jgi:hypothetical protein
LARSCTAGRRATQALAEIGESHGCFPSQKEAAAALQRISLDAALGEDTLKE